MGGQLAHTIIERYMEIDAQADLIRKQQDRINELELGIYLCTTALAGMVAKVPAGGFWYYQLETIRLNALGALWSDDYLARGTLPQYTPEQPAQEQP